MSDENKTIDLPMSIPCRNCSDTHDKAKMVHDIAGKKYICFTCYAELREEDVQ